ncbi:FtsX-like permease family protein [Alcaligenaceae bacterium]|nr:FtsX-like permease family protein [Alcaligenaceae bacterium]
MHAGIVSIVRFGLRSLRRDWRSGELRLLALALVTAVTAVTSVGFLADRVGGALERDSAQMLGADLAVRSADPIPSPFGQRALELGLTTAQTVQFPSMAGTDSTMQLASLKAVSPGYPLRGQLRTADGTAPSGAAHPADGIPAPGTAWADAQLLNQLDIEPGQAVTLGEASFTVARIITYEPDRGMEFVNVAPRIMINMSDLPATGLVATGSRVRHQLLVAGSPAQVQRYQDWISEKVVDGQTISTPQTSRPQLRSALTRAEQFLQLVALLTVMIAAVAVALATRRYTLRHRDGIAVMRCLGASRRQLGISLWVEFLALGLITSAVGALAGFAVHEGLVLVVSAWLDTSLPPATLEPVWQGLAAGLLLLMGFALPPLAALPKVAPARVLRRDDAGPPLRRWPSYAFGVAAFFALTVWISGDLRLSSVVTGGFAVALVLFALTAHALVAVLGRLRHRAAGHAALRFALAGLVRRRGLTVTQLCALSTGLMILLLLAITRTDLLQGWQGSLEPDAPNTFLINIQPEQRSSVQARLKEEGLQAVTFSPMIRGRLVAISDKAVNADDYKDARAQRMAKREFNLSYTDTLPDSNETTAGRWLDPQAHEASLETGLAATLGIAVGDTLTFDVAGRDVKVAVVGLREVDWDSFQTNFFAVLSPAALVDAPASYITSLHVPAEQAAGLLAVLRDFPNLTLFDIGSLLGQVQHVLDQVVRAVQLLFLFTVIAGVLVLAAALAATRDERIHEVAILRALGASRRQLVAAQRIELLIVGGLAGLLAAGGAVAVAGLLARLVFEFPLAWSWWPWVAGIGIGIAASLLGGTLALAGVLKTPPLVSLREAT